MRKIDNKVENNDGTSVLATAKLCLEKQKYIKLTDPRRVALAATIFTIAALLSVFGNPIYVFINLCSLCSILISSNSLKKTSIAALKVLSARIALLAYGYNGLENAFIERTEVEIVPKNMQIGEDLESLNIVPIFKEGHYVIVRSVDFPCFIRVFENEGEEEAYVMEPTDEDIEILEHDLPEYQEYIDALKLQKTLPHLLQ